MAASNWRRILNYHPLFKSLQKDFHAYKKQNDCKNIMCYYHQEVFVWNGENRILNGNLTQSKGQDEIEQEKKLQFQVLFKHTVFFNILYIPLHCLGVFMLGTTHI